MNTSSSWLRSLGASVLLPIVCTSCGQTTKTGIEGTITISPIRPGPTRIDEPDSAPLQKVSFAVESETGAVTDFTTDDLGKFHVLLKPGHYKVSLQGERRIRRCGPFEVDVAAAGMTTVQWRCDSGMR